MHRPSQNQPGRTYRKVLTRICRKRVERETEGVLGKHQIGFRRRKGTWDIIGKLKIISQQTLNILVYEEMCACFRDWHQAFDRVNWT
jgi:hypothetical protein